MKLTLKQALAGHSIPAYKVAQEIDIPPSRLYRITIGLTKPTGAEKLKISQALKFSSEEIFQDEFDKPDFTMKEDLK